MPDIYHRVFIKSTPEKIYEAISTQKSTASWWSDHINSKTDLKSQIITKSNCRYLLF